MENEEEQEQEHPDKIISRLVETLGSMVNRLMDYKVVNGVIEENPVKNSGIHNMYFSLEFDNGYGMDINMEDRGNGNFIISILPDSLKKTWSEDKQQEERRKAKNVCNEMLRESGISNPMFENFMFYSRLSDENKRRVHDMFANKMGTYMSDFLDHKDYPEKKLDAETSREHKLVEAMETVYSDVQKICGSDEVTEETCDVFAQMLCYVPDTHGKVLLPDHKLPPENRESLDHYMNHEMMNQIIECFRNDIKAMADAVNSIMNHDKKNNGEKPGEIIPSDISIEMQPPSDTRAILSRADATEPLVNSLDEKTYKQRQIELTKLIREVVDTYAALYTSKVMRDTIGEKYLDMELGKNPFREAAKMLWDELKKHIDKKKRKGWTDRDYKNLLKKWRNYLWGAQMMATEEVNEIECPDKLEGVEQLVYAMFKFMGYREGTDDEERD